MPKCSKCGKEVKRKVSKKRGKDGYFREMFNTKPWDILKG